jgi:UDP-N-acetylmuramoyl-tripeptide--D-alanyl-D-alanine ligase
VVRLTIVYAFLIACVSYLVIGVLALLSKINGSQLYAFIAYVPFAVMPLLLPVLLCGANALTGVFENAHNKKFVKRMGQVLDESKIIRVGVVGSYGKTSVKNILKTLLSEKYSVIATPASYNTPIGVAKTVQDPAFQEKQVLIAEMGARKAGDIAQLCQMVKPNYAIFTGVCEQHIETFGSIEKVWKAKSEIFDFAEKVICGKSLQAWLEQDERIEKQKAIFKNGVEIKDVSLQATHTSFLLCVDGKEFAVTTKLLGKGAVENIFLSAMLAYEMGLTGEEIARGIAKLEYIPHRLQLLEKNGVYILDDGYNCNPKGAEESLAALARFAGKKCLVTPGIVECGVLEEKINGELGEKIAKYGFDKVVLVGDTLVGAVKAGYQKVNGDESRLSVARTLEDAAASLGEWLQAEDAVLFLNDLPDVY